MSSPDDDNLLSALHTWAHDHSENFVTEAFAHLLRRLLRHERELAAELLHFLTRGTIDAGAIQAGSVSVTTQFTTKKGTPDIAIWTSDALVFIEVKVGAPLSDGQLQGYYEVLEAEQGKRTRLVLLSKHRKDADLEPDKYTALRWYKVGDILRKRLRTGVWEDDLSAFLVRQFFEFLKGEGITMEQVSGYLPDGVRALCNLRDMLSAVLEQVGLKLAQSYGWNWVARGRGAVWVGIRLDAPTVVIFEVFLPEDGTADTEQLGFGCIANDTRYNKPCWRHTVDLASEEVHFFARSSESQARLLEEFVLKSMEGLRVIRPEEDVSDIENDSAEENV